VFPPIGKASGRAGWNPLAIQSMVGADATLPEGP